MVQITFEVPEGVLASLHSDVEHLTKEMRLAASVLWYESGRISQEMATKIAGLSRTEFLQALLQYQVSPFQVHVEELIQEAKEE